MIELKELYQNLDNVTKNFSRLELNRDYIGLSQFYQCPRKLINDYNERLQKTVEASFREHQKAYNGYTFEERMKQRLWAIYKNSYIMDFEIIVPNSKDLIKGHTDGIINNEILVEYFTVSNDSFIPQFITNISKRKYTQMQAYMTFSDYKKTLCICESRETGNIKLFIVSYKDSVGNVLKQKADIILKYRETKELPKCWCRKCQK